MSVLAVLDEAAPVVEPVLDKAISPVDSIVEPALDEATPVTEPVLNEATSIVEPLDEAVEPVSWPPLEATGPAAEPAPVVAASPEEPVPGAVSPAVQPFTGAAVPDVEPVFGIAAPVVEPGLGEEDVLGSGELSASGGLLDVLPASLPAISSHEATAAEAVEAWSTLPDSRPAPATSGVERNSSSHSSDGKTQPSRVGLLDARFGLFHRSPTTDGRHATLPGPTAAEYSQNQIPSAPFGFPSGAPPVGSSL